MCVCVCGGGGGGGTIYGLSTPQQLMSRVKGKSMQVYVCTCVHIILYKLCSYIMATNEAYSMSPIFSKHTSRKYSHNHSHPASCALRTLSQVHGGSGTHLMRTCGQRPSSLHELKYRLYVAAPVAILVYVLVCMTDAFHCCPSLFTM